MYIFYKTIYDPILISPFIEMAQRTSVPASDFIIVQKSRNLALWAGKTFSLSREKK